MTKRLAYLGPAGTFTEEAALRYDSQAQLIPFSSIPAVVDAVITSMAEEGVVPIENSLEGSVPDTLDLLIHEATLFIRQELVLPIEHYLLAREGTQASEIEIIYSHPQALGQCRLYLERWFPTAHRVAALSTAAAVEDMKSSQVHAAAVGTRRAADLYGTQILASGIQDHPSNATRFVILGPTDHPKTGRDKTSLCFSFQEDRPGLLYEVMGEFAQRNINVAKVESRPTKQSLGRYTFLIDLEGHKEDQSIRDALERLAQIASMLRVFGSYPRFPDSSS